MAYRSNRGHSGSGGSSIHPPVAFPPIAGRSARTAFGQRLPAVNAGGGTS
jgi:hypothetical protein